MIMKLSSLNCQTCNGLETHSPEPVNGWPRCFSAASIRIALNRTESAREFPVELIIVGNFPVRCHGLDVAQLLESWLLAGAHITVFSDLFLGLRTDPESTKGGAIDVGSADPYRVIVSTRILRTLLQIQGYSLQN
jgi:hypothetical protein